MIYSWLKDDLGFPHLSKIKWNNELEQGFFDGIVASIGSLKKSGIMDLTEHDLEFVKEISELSKRLGFTPQIYSLEEKIEGERYWTYKINFSQKEVKRMNLINPKHLLKA